MLFMSFHQYEITILTKYICNSEIYSSLAAIVESRDIYIYQRPLVPHLEALEATDFLEARPLIRPLFHCIGLLWGNSRYYCSVEKLIRECIWFMTLFFDGVTILSNVAMNGHPKKSFHKGNKNRKSNCL